MKTWPIMKLGDIGEWGSGGTPLTSVPEYYQNGIIPWLIIEDLNDGVVTSAQKFITKAGLRNSSAKLVEAGTLLIAMYGSIGKLGIAGMPCATNQAIAFCKCDPKIVDVKFLFHFLIHSREKLITEGKGITQQNISQTVLKAFPIPLPPLPEQQRIAALLDKADRVRRLRRYARELSDSVLQAVFLEMFGDPVENRRGWEVKDLRKLCRNITDGTHDTPLRTPSGVPFITSKNVRPYEFDLSDLEFVSEETHREIIKRCNPQYGDVLYTNIGVNIGNAVANRLNFSFSLKNVALLQPNQQLLNPFFLESLLNNERFKQHLIHISSAGGAQKFISLAVLRSLSIISPPMLIQEKFAQIVKRYERLRDQQREAERQGEILFQSLLHDTFEAKP